MRSSTWKTGTRSSPMIR